MCPDRQTLSALVDGEVPSPWREKLFSHVETCPGCSEIVREYRGVSERIVKSAAPGESAARDAVWARLTDPRRIRRREPLWSTRFAIPLPLAAAALLAIGILSTLVISFRGENRALRMAIFAASELTPPMGQSVTMESVLQFLESQDAKVSVTVQLPPGAGVETFGKPVIMKASSREPVVGEDGR